MVGKGNLAVFPYPPNIVCMLLIISLLSHPPVYESAVDQTHRNQVFPSSSSTPLSAINHSSSEKR